MKPLMLIGAILTALGIIALVVGGGISYTSQEKLPHGGSARVTAKNERVLSIPPWAGGLVLAGGITLMVVAARE